MLIPGYAIENGLLQLYLDLLSVQSQIAISKANGTALSLGDSSHEGGDIVVYRDSSGNIQFKVDADAASNEKALDVYGGVVVQNYLTVGQSSLNTTYPLYVNGEALVTNHILTNYSLYTGGEYGIYIGNAGLKNRVTNQSAININNSVSGTDATDHTVNLKIDSNDIIVAHATGDGAGGIIGKRAIFTGGQSVSKIDAGAADYNPSSLTSDYIITVDTTAAARNVIISTEDRDTGSATSPRIFKIMDIAGNAGANNITVSLETAGNINGAANYTIGNNYGCITLMIDGTNGYVIGVS